MYLKNSNNDFSFTLKHKTMYLFYSVMYLGFFNFNIKYFKADLLNGNLYNVNVMR